MRISSLQNYARSVMLNFVQPTKEEVKQNGIDSRFLNPGEFHFGHSNCQIHTLLGSCIAITLWHPKFLIGGMCHYMLPGSPIQNNVMVIKSNINARYSDLAMSLFEQNAIKYGTNLNEYQAKIFGGSNMFVNTAQREDKLIGLKNTEAAIKHLHKKHIPLVASHVGTTGHRRIVFDVKSGEVWVKHAPLNS